MQKRQREKVGPSADEKAISGAIVLFIFRFFGTNADYARTDTRTGFRRLARANRYHAKGRGPSREETFDLDGIVRALTENCEAGAPQSGALLSFVRGIDPFAVANTLRMTGA